MGAVWSDSSGVKQGSYPCPSPTLEHRKKKRKSADVKQMSQRMHVSPNMMNVKSASIGSQSLPCFNSHTEMLKCESVQWPSSMSWWRSQLCPPPLMSHTRSYFDLRKTKSKRHGPVLMLFCAFNKCKPYFCVAPALQPFWWIPTLNPLPPPYSIVEWCKAQAVTDFFLLHLT